MGIDGNIMELSVIDLLGNDVVGLDDDIGDSDAVNMERMTQPRDALDWNGRGLLNVNMHVDDDLFEIVFAALLTMVTMCNGVLYAVMFVRNETELLTIVELSMLVFALDPHRCGCIVYGDDGRFVDWMRGYVDIQAEFLFIEREQKLHDAHCDTESQTMQCAHRITVACSLLVALVLFDDAVELAIWTLVIDLMSIITVFQIKLETEFVDADIDDAYTLIPHDVPARYDEHAHALYVDRHELTRCLSQCVRRNNAAVAALDALDLNKVPFVHKIDEYDANPLIHNDCALLEALMLTNAEHVVNISNGSTAEYIMHICIADWRECRPRGPGDESDDGV